jgi:ribosome-binding protein aMBF1 (putative translation factor)
VIKETALGNEIHNARIERWWSLKSLAEYLEIPIQELYAIEQGELLPSDRLANDIRLWLVTDEEIDRAVRSLFKDRDLV